LMRDKLANIVSKIPLLGDLPILGYLFKHKIKSVEKTNLLIVLTPFVIRNQGDLRQIFKKKLQDRREFIERYTSFAHHDLAQDIDYRHKRGLLSEIDRVGRRVEEEVKLIEEAKKATDEAVSPVEIPEGMMKSDLNSNAEGETPSEILPTDGRNEPVPGGDGVIQIRPPSGP
ncbi:MAG: hypothetical protein V1754_12570, partial [Pseudomonadota bacterium]